MSQSALNPDDLIREAYSVVAEPEKLFDLQVQLELAQARSDEAVAALDPHFEQIGAMFDAIHLGPEADFSQMALSPGDPDPVLASDAALLVLDEDLRLVAFREKDWAEQRLATRQYAPDWLFGYHSDALRRVRRGFNEGAPGEILYFRMYGGEEDARGFMVQAELVEFGAHKRLSFHKVSLEWEESDGRQFAQAMGLSEAERELTAFIVDGRSVAEFATSRGRSVGTARNQMKAVLRKLGIGSQAELVSLYAGFAGSLALRDWAPQNSDAEEGQSIALPGGPPLRYERYGLPGGRPVLLLHGAIEGPFLTPNLQHRAHSAELDLFVPWMPFYSDKDRPSDPRARIEWFVERLDQFCEAMRIDRCPILACSLSSAYGLAALKRHPERFVGLVACGFTPPFDRLGELGELNPIWRAPLVLSRTAPGVVELLVRSVVRLAMKGEAYRYFDKLLKDSPVDRMTLNQPDIASVVRKAFQARPDKAGRALAHAIQVQALDWSPWLDDHARPVRIVMGEQDVVHSPQVQRGFCESCGFETIGPLTDVGGFSLFQTPERIFHEVRRFYGE
ncbi:MAG: hypothetical protein AAF251_00320 [Pseudomonadota bacterium]